MPLTKTGLASMIMLLTVQCVSSQAQKGQAERKSGATPITGPCEVLSTGGTVFDTTECEELARTGRLIQKDKRGHPTAIVVDAGRTTEWQLVAKRKEKSVVGIPVMVISKRDHSTVAKTVTDRTGTFRLSIPSSFQGDSGIKVDDDNVGFCFRILPAEESHMEIICVEDDEFDYCPLRVVHVRQR